MNSQKQQLINYLKTKDIAKPVLQAFQEIPRDEFVPQHLQDRAWQNTALPIGHNQTISQPYTIARTLTLLVEKLPPGDARILDVGSGSGYQTALLSTLYSKITGLEIVPELAQKARQTLKNLDIKNTEILQKDATKKHFDDGTFSGVVLAASTPKLPQAIIDQTKKGGIIIAPIGKPRNCHLTRFIKTKKGLKKQTFQRYLFVPLISN